MLEGFDKIVTVSVCPNLQVKSLKHFQDFIYIISETSGKGKETTFCIIIII